MRPAVPDPETPGPVWTPRLGPGALMVLANALRRPEIRDEPESRRPVSGLRQSRKTRDVMALRGEFRLPAHGGAVAFAAKRRTCAGAVSARRPRPTPGFSGPPMTRPRCSDLTAPSVSFQPTRGRADRGRSTRGRWQLREALLTAALSIKDQSWDSRLRCLGDSALRGPNPATGTVSRQVIGPSDRGNRGGARPPSRTRRQQRR